jgi:hypothetical protein
MVADYDSRRDQTFGGTLEPCSACSRCVWKFQRMGTGKTEPQRRSVEARSWGMRPRPLIERTYYARLDEGILPALKVSMANARAIRAPALPQDARSLKFSFKYLDKDHPKFATTRCHGEFMDQLIHALCRYSGGSVDYFTDMSNEDFRHSFDFAGTTEPNGFRNLEEELKEELPWQFAVCPGVHTPPHAGWRVYGFILEDTFYVVWLDTSHQLFPDGKFRQD